MTEEIKRLNPKWRERIKQVGKESFQKEEMLVLGFWKPTSLKGRDLDNAKNHLQETLNKLSTKRKELGELFKKIRDAQDVEKIIFEIRKRRIERVKVKKEERRIAKKAQKETKTKKDDLRRLITPPFLGRGVSGKLNFDGGDEKRIQDLRVPKITNVSDLSNFLEIKENKIAWLCYHREVTSCDHYHRFNIPKKDGSPRIIAAPKTYLRNVQTWINAEILAQIELENAATAFRKERNILDNANPHCDRGLVIRVDLKDFFFSITFPRVRGFFESLGYNSGISTVLALLCTDTDRKKISYKSRDWFVSEGIRRLPQGATTSPALSNLIVRKLDRRINGLLNSIDKDWVYTRYADDLVISHPSTDTSVGKVIRGLKTIIKAEGFLVNEKKTAVMRDPNRQMITGLLLNNKKPRIPRAYLKKVRAMLHKADKLFQEGATPENIHEIKGKLSFINMVMPEHAKKISSKYSWLNSNQELV